MEGDAQSGHAQHGQVVRAVAHGNGLRDVHLLHLGDEPQQFRLALAVHHVAHVAAGQLAVHHLQLVGVDVIDAILLLQVFAEIGESAGQDGNLVAILLQNIHQAVHALGDGQVLGNVLHDAHVQPLQQGHPLAEALHEVNLAPHGPLGDSLHLVAHPGAHGQLVDDLRLNQRGVHVEANQAAHASVHVVQLEGEIHLQLRSHLHQLRLHLLAVLRRAAHREFDAGFRLRLGLVQGDAARQALDGVDVHALVGQDAGGCGNLVGGQLAAQQRQDVAVLALHAHPVLVLLGTDGIEPHRHTQCGSLEQQFLHDEARMLLLRLAQDAQGEGAVDVRLSDVQDGGVILGQNLHHRGGQARTVFARDADQDKFRCGRFLYVHIRNRFDKSR